MGDDFGKPDANKLRHLQLVSDDYALKNDLQQQIRSLLSQCSAPEDEQKTLARMTDESAVFERLTSIQAWGPELKALAQLLISTPFHPKKISFLHQKHDLYYSIKRHRLDVHDEPLLCFCAISLFLLAIILFGLSSLVFGQVQGLRELVTGLFLAGLGLGIMVSGASILRPWLMCRVLRPHIERMYQDEQA